MSVVFSPDGTRIMSGSEDKTVRIWDASNGACLQTLEGHSYSINSVVFSPDGTRIASGSLDSIIRIWDASNGVCLQTLKGSGFSGEFDAGTLSIIARRGAFNIQNMCETPQHLTHGLNTGGTWITSNGQNVIRLPSEYRPASFGLAILSLVVEQVGFSYLVSLTRRLLT